MPTPSEAYSQEIREAREDVYESATVLAQQVQSRVEESLAEVEPPTDASSEQLKDLYEDRLQRLNSNLQADVQEQQDQVEEEMNAAHAAAIAAAVSAAAASLPDSEVPTPDTYAQGLTISINVHRAVDESTEDMIERAVSQAGAEIAEAIDQGGSTADVVAGIADAVTDRTSNFDFQALKQLTNNLTRTVSHEVAAYADEVGKELTARNPAVDLVRWETSARHDSLSSSPDICDVFEQADLYGYGSGLFHPATVPALPHPYCECQQSVVLKPLSEWGSGGREVPSQPDLNSGFMKRAMADIPGDRSVTDAHVQHQTDMASSVLGAVHESPRGV
jgi:hypothetical protein